MLDDAGRFLFLASGVAGRRVVVKFIASQADDSLAHSDGAAIFVPARTASDLTQSWREIVAQAALLAAGSLEPSLLRQLVGRKQVAERYLYAEILRAATVFSGRLPAVFLDRPEIDGVPTLSSSAAESLALACGARPLPCPPDYFGSIRPLLVIRSRVREQGLSALVRTPVAGQRQQNADGSDGEAARQLPKLLRGESRLMQLFSRLSRTFVAPNDGTDMPADSSGVEMPVGQTTRAARRGVRHASFASTLGPSSAIKDTQEYGHVYPEWNVHARQYRPNWVVVVHGNPSNDPTPYDQRAFSTVIPRELRRQLAGLGLNHEMHSRQSEGTEFDTGRLIDAALDLAAGQVPQLDIYRSSKRTRRDLAVAIMLDVSGSTGEREEQSGSVFAKQVGVAYQLSRTLSDLGDTVALLGFRSWGRGFVEVLPLKTVAERWSEHVTDRLRQLEPRGYSRLGAAVRHGAHLLRTATRLPNRLLIFVSDGVAYDDDYESSYAQADTRMALQEARACGIGVVCLCIGGALNAEQLQRVFGAANLLMVDDPAQIVMKIRGVCRRALGAVSKRRLQRV